VTGPQILVLVTGILVLGFILRLVRRRELRGKYSLLWLAVGVFGLVIALVPGLLDDVADWFDVGYPPAILFVIAIAFLLLVVVHLSWELTRLEDRTRTLAQELAMLRHDLEPGSPNGAAPAPQPAASPEPERDQPSGSSSSRRLPNGSET
jgi:hypothetical protein